MVSEYNNTVGHTSSAQLNRGVNERAGVSWAGIIILFIYYTRVSMENGITHGALHWSTNYFIK